MASLSPDMLEPGIVAIDRVGAVMRHTEPGVAGGVMRDVLGDIAQILLIVGVLSVALAFGAYGLSLLVRQ